MGIMILSINYDHPALARSDDLKNCISNKKPGKRRFFETFRPHERNQRAACHWRQGIVHRFDSRQHTAWNITLAVNVHTGALCNRSNRDQCIRNKKEPLLFLWDAIILRDQNREHAERQ